jgi:septal ring factor EnvC (AmiA/AmiB activator)
MPGDAVAGVEFAPSTTAAIRSETLYVELRHRGRPIDPGDWFAMNGAQP